MPSVRPGSLQPLPPKAFGRFQTTPSQEIAGLMGFPPWVITTGEGKLPNKQQSIGKILREVSI